MTKSTPHPEEPDQGDRDPAQQIDDLDVILASSAPAIDRLLTDVDTHLSVLGWPRVPEAMVLLRELVLNAHTHGNKRDASRTIRVSIRRCHGRSLQITVQDEGDGFDARAIDVEMPSDPRHVKRRGYFLVRKIANDLIVEDGGRRIVATLEPETVEDRAGEQPDTHTQSGG